MSTIGSVSATSSLLASRATQLKGNAEAFKNALEQAQGNSASGPDIATISDTARARLGDPMAQYYGEVSVEVSSDTVAKWRTEAAAVSKSQGLPDGQYDFTSMNSTQMNSVINDYIGKGVSRDRLNGLMLTAAQIQEFTPQAGSTTMRSTDGAMNASQWLTDMYRWNVEQGGGTSNREALFLKGSLDIVSDMRKITGK